MTLKPESKTGLPEALAGLASSQQNPTFNEPWEAQAFAMTVALQRSGLFSWNEWAETLGEQIKLAQANGDPDLGTTYYHHWLAAIEKLVQEKGIADQSSLRRYQEAWHHAAHRTPHGQPIELTAQDFDERHEQHLPESR